MTLLDVRLVLLLPRETKNLVQWTASATALPGLNGFVGEFMIFKGAFPIVTA